jgi:transcription elongation factor GreA
MASVEKLPMLAEGYERLTRRAEGAARERPRIVDAIEEARAHGDLSENAEYHAAKERQGQVEASIADLEDKVSRAQIIDPTTLSGDKIIFGATVTLLDDDDKPVRYQIVGPYEADAKIGRISYNSPLGQGADRPQGGRRDRSAPCRPGDYQDLLRGREDRVHLTSAFGQQCSHQQSCPSTCGH